MLVMPVAALEDCAASVAADILAAGLPCPERSTALSPYQAPHRLVLSVVWHC
jgi:hypothetical protein